MLDINKPIKDTYSIPRNKFVIIKCDSRKSLEKIKLIGTEKLSYPNINAKKDGVNKKRISGIKNNNTESQSHIFCDLLI